MSAILRKASSVKWIALSRGTNNKVVGIGSTIREAIAIARKNGELEPFIVKCRRRPPVFEPEREIPGSVLWPGLTSAG